MDLFRAEHVMNTHLELTEKSRLRLWGEMISGAQIFEREAAPAETTSRVRTSSVRHSHLSGRESGATSPAFKGKKAGGAMQRIEVSRAEKEEFILRQKLLHRMIQKAPKGMSMRDFFVDFKNKYASSNGSQPSSDPQEQPSPVAPKHHVSSAMPAIQEIADNEASNNDSSTRQRNKSHRAASPVLDGSSSRQEVSPHGSPAAAKSFLTEGRHSSKGSWRSLTSTRDGLPSPNMRSLDEALLEGLQEPTAGRGGMPIAPAKGLVLQKQGLDGVRMGGYVYARRFSAVDPLSGDDGSPDFLTRDVSWKDLVRKQHVSS